MVYRFSNKWIIFVFKLSLETFNARWCKKKLGPNPVTSNDEPPHEILY